MIVLAEFQKILGYTFKNETLLLQALTHKSFTVERQKEQIHNERLEFLGDAILNMVVAEKLFSDFPGLPEGLLSKRRAALVNAKKLAEIGSRYELQRYIRFGPGEIEQGHHLNSRIQGSCVEALIGAIYQDSDFANARSWILRQYTAEDLNLNNADSFVADFKSRLQELVHKHQLGVITYELLLSTGPSHRPQFLISLKINGAEMSRAEASSKKAAEQKAAEIFLSTLLKKYKETESA